MIGKNNLLRRALRLTPLYRDPDVIGRVKARLLPPDLTEADFKLWWPRLTEKERDRYTAYETKNVITVNGRNNILTFISSTSLGSVVPFAMYFSVGTSPIITVSAGDTTIQGELFRAIPSTSIIAGNTINISTFFGSTQGNGTYTNAGLWGNNATGVSGSGTLYTHALYSLIKTNGNTLTSDYLITLN